MSQALAKEPDRVADPYVVEGWDSRAARPGLSSAMRRRARLLAEALYADEDGPPPAARLDWMEADLADFFGHVSLRARLVFWVCVTSLHLLAPLLSGRLATLGGLSVPDRVRAIERADKTPLALALLGAKAIVSLVYFEHPDAAREIGWDQECRLP